MDCVKRTNNPVCHCASQSCPNEHSRVIAKSNSVSSYMIHNKFTVLCMCARDYCHNCDSLSYFFSNVRVQDVHSEFILKKFIIDMGIMEFSITVVTKKRYDKFLCTDLRKYDSKLFGDMLEIYNKSLQKDISLFRTSKNEKIYIMTKDVPLDIFDKCVYKTTTYDCGTFVNHVFTPELFVQATVFKDLRTRIVTFTSYADYGNGTVVYNDLDEFYKLSEEQQKFSVYIPGKITYTDIHNLMCAE